MMQMGGGPKANIRVFREALLNPDNGIRMDPEHVLEPDDLLKYNVGSEQEQEDKQQRVLTCILELGYCASNMGGYMVRRVWPCFVVLV